MSDSNELIRGKLKRVFVFLFVFMFFLVYIKMCSVSVNDIDNREPLRQIDNWK